MSLEHIPNPVHRYMMAAYAYYERFESLMEDHEFDALAKKLLDQYDYWGKHPHCPTEDDLRAGTYLGEYPQIVVVATEMYMRDVYYPDLARQSGARSRANDVSA